MGMQQFKLAVLSLDDFTDAEIQKLFLDLEVTSESDIHEAVEVVAIHRPNVLNNLSITYAPSSAA